ncbi:AAA family ATPase [Glycomyces luteolus]|uniref:AAA family ATPase n=1 Tax=Glycomyces luteolus TaxID=2670330 RepID=A0A9X3SP83_9ACTN|nr:AAA family ATPase [Glycomyces luteolus]MDA1359082.1 AAA family ATPase [Glycomyces luteolus]
MAAAHDDSEQETLHKRRAQDGIRQAVRQAGGRLAAASHPAVMTMLCAAACAPVAAAAIGVGASVSAAIAVVGGVGGTFLAQTVDKLVKRLEPASGGPGPTVEQIRAAIEAGLTDALAAEQDQARLIELGIGSLMSATDGARVALDEAIKSGNRELADLIVGSTERLEAVIAGQHGQTRAELGENTLLTQMVLSGVRQTIDLLEERTVTESVRQRSAAAWEGRNPYRGLEPFRPEHAPVYFGRDLTTASLVANVRRRFIAGEIQIVTGASGAGKSSLLQAGLMDAFAKGAFPDEGSQHWPRCVIRPSYPEPNPLANLASAIAGIAGRDPADVQRSLEERPERAEQLARAALRNRSDDASARLVLVVDQFEEVFSASTDAETRDRFVSALTAIASNQRESAGLVVLGVRGDFIERCAEIDLLGPALSHPFIVRQMRRDEMREAVTGPARAAGLNIEHALVDTILDDARGAGGPAGFGTGALPLLSEAMRRLWEAQERQTGGAATELTRAAYAESGRVADAVAKTADEVLASLDEDQKALARSLFLRLLTIDDDKVTREPRSRSKLVSLLGPEAGPVIDAFVTGRLLVTDDPVPESEEEPGDEKGDESGPTVEIAHECLFWHWAALREWIDEDRAVLARRGKLANDAKDWDANGRGSSFLYQGAKLADLEKEVEESRSANPERFPELDSLPEQFIQAGREHAERRHRLRRLAIAGLASLLALALTGAFLIYVANREVAEATQTLADRESWERSLSLAEASAEAGLTDGDLARLLAAAAWETAETNQAWAAMTDALGNPATGMLTEGHDTDFVRSADFSDDGSILVTGADDGTIAVWDTSTWRAERLDFKWETAIGELQVSPDGQSFAISAWSNDSARAEVQVLDKTGRTVALLEGGFESDATIAFAPDGAMLAASGAGRTKVWDLATEELLDTIETGAGTISQLAFAKPGDDILTTDADFVQWRLDPASNSDEASAVMAEEQIQSSPIGDAADSYIVTCGTGCLVRTAADGDDGVLPKIDVSSTASYTDDGRLRAVVDNDLNVQVDEVDTGAAYGVIRSGSIISEVAIRPDGKVVVAATQDGLQTWSLESLRGRAVLSPFGLFDDFGLSADGSRLTIAGPAAVQFWNVEETPRLEQELASGEYPAGTFTTVGADGEIAATRVEYDSAEILIWNPSTGEIIRELTDSGSTVFAMGFQDENRLATIHRADFDSHDGPAGVTVWNLESGEKEAGIEWEENPARMAMDFSPDLSQVATVDGEGGIRVWDIASGGRTTRLEGHYPDVSAVAFSPDGSSLAAATGRGIAVWDLTSPEDAPVVHLPRSVFNSVIGYTPDGTHIVVEETVDSFFDGGKILVWDIERELVVAELYTRDSMYTYAFSDDGSTLATLGLDGIDILSLDFLTQDPYDLVCERTGRGFTDAEAEQYLAELPAGARNVCADA